MSGHEVKTRQTFRQWADDAYGRHTLADNDMEVAWNAALASVILPEGRFEVGDEVEIQTQSGTWETARIQAVSKDARNYTYLSDYVRPIPRTVELTVEEKLEEVYAKSGLTQFKIMVALANGKTLDQLCAEYNIPTTKELS